MSNPTKVTTKLYKCAECGHTTKQDTNHNGKTWSFGHYNCCPKCPPFKKYPEFGGQTVWEFVKEVDHD